MTPMRIMTRALPLLAAGLLSCAICLPRAALAAETIKGKAALLSPDAVAERVKSAAESHEQIVRARSVAKSPGKRDVWLVELGKGADAERATRPAMLLAAGIEGNDLVGPAAAVAWIERLVGQYEGNETIRKLLDTTTIYVFPCVNPDGAANYFAKPRAERSTNNKPVDDDHDGMTDEDGPEDLDGDGRIVSMRVKDPEGEHVADSSEPRLLVRADKSKGQQGVWRLLTEGRDNDKDERWNEDGRGGVNFNRNFPYRYEWFAADSGVHQISEAETRALADFIVNHQNIGIAFAFGSTDNLAQTPRGESAPTSPSRATGRIVTAIGDRDLPYYRHLGSVYRKTLGLSEEVQSGSQPGTFSDWMYFHRGRLSLAAQPWSAAMELKLSGEKPKAEKKSADEENAEAEEKDGNGSAGEEKKASVKSKTKGGPAKSRSAASSAARAGEPSGASAQDRDFLKWLDKNAPDGFVRWHAFEHPDFPGKEVEIGGFAPFAKTLPPAKLLPNILTKQGDFLTTLALRLPRVGIRKVESKHLGKSVYEVKVQVENTGYLPTSLRQGETTNEVYPTRVVLDLEPKAFLSGTRTARLTAIEGSGGMREVRCIVHVPERKDVKISVISMLGGSAETTLQLGGEK